MEASSFGPMSITKLGSDTTYSLDRVYRILNWLQSKGVIKFCGKPSDDFVITCKSFDSAMINIKKFVI